MITNESEVEMVLKCSTHSSFIDALVHVAKGDASLDLETVAFTSLHDVRVLEVVRLDERPDEDRSALLADSVMEAVVAGCIFNDFW